MVDRELFKFKLPHFIFELGLENKVVGEDSIADHFVRDNFELKFGLVRVETDLAVAG